MAKGWKGDVGLFGYVDKEFFDGRWSVWHTGMHTIDVHRNSYLMRRYMPLEEQTEKNIARRMREEMAEIEEAHKTPGYEYKTTGWMSWPIVLVPKRA